MKYLYFIIRHFFPKRKWEIIHTMNYYSEYNEELPVYKVYVLKDQFGNIKQKKIKG